jgi:RNA polymerase sigma-70 factor, ECF subfamily
MATIEVIDPPMCCPTGVCGRVTDPTLERFAADAQWLAGQGIAVRRKPLEQAKPIDAVRQAVEEHGPDCLPLIVVDGRLVSRGRYPSRDELAALVGVGPTTHSSLGSDQGTETALTQKLASYRETIRGYVLAIVRDKDAAEELTQDTLVRAQESASSLRDHSKLLPWLHRIATNLCYDRFRRASHRGRALSLDTPADGEDGITRADALADDAPRLDKALEQSEMSACVQDYLAELPAPQRAVLLLHDVQGLTNPGISTMLDVSLATVKIRLHRARRKLRTALSEGCTFSCDERGVTVCEPKSPEDKE